MTDSRKEMLAALSNQHLATEELGLKMKEHSIAALRNDTEKMRRLRDECLSAFYAVISANESAAIVVRKLTEG